MIYLKAKNLIVFFFITLLFVLSHSVHISYAQITNPEGDKQKSGSEDIWANTLEGSHYNEFWTWQFYFDNGMKLHVVFSVANFGRFKSAVSGVRVSLFGLDEKTYQIAREYPIDELLQEHDSGLFSINPRQENVWFRGELPHEMELYINTSKDGNRFKIDLKMENLVPGLKWDDGIYHIGEEPIGIITHIPFGKVSGTAGINDDVREVSGTVYMDHTYQDDTTTNLMDSGYRFVKHTDSENWDIIYFLLPDNNNSNQTLGHRLHSKDGEVSLNGIENIENYEIRDAFGEEVYDQISLKFSDGRTAILNREVDQERFSILSDLSWVARRTAQAVLGGDVIDIRGKGNLKKDNESFNGEFNFFIVD